MQRRQYLLGGTVAMAAVVGCLDDEGGASSDVGAEDRTGERAFSRAVGGLNDAAIALREAEDLDDPESVDFDPEVPRNHLETARGHLETADEELGDERGADLEELRTYASVLEAAIHVAATVADETLFDDVEAVERALDDDGDRSEATLVIDERESDLEAADVHLDDGKAALAEIDADRFADLPTADLADLEAGVSTLANVLRAQSALAAGYASTLEGDDRLERGREYADDGSHDEATEEFTAAKAAFDEAIHTFDDGVDDAPADLVAALETGRCRSENLHDGAAHLAASSAAADEGNVRTARNRQSDAESAFAAAEDCGE
ncbi:hypothetical protein [Natrarchaeobius chitinivorans]|uniref:Uncharacterized protein n=1 Tax=Natrarchaeobius chitinivorans TaxID=1679083 RepID=A0A3N6LUT7_NATCH|nr:hypothetical protein [Natrarchaeobius chitinivorans]RQG94063.1 hypothetical protein EA473_13420 [Natrarchaeobius chitinivorans]